MWVYHDVCVRTHTHTHYTDGVLECEPKSLILDETPGGPEESGWTKSRYIWTKSRNKYSYVYKVHMCSIYILGDWMRSWTNCFSL